MDLDLAIWLVTLHDSLPPWARSIVLVVALLVVFRAVNAFDWGRS